MSDKPQQPTVESIARHVGGTFTGDGCLAIQGISDFDHAESGQLTLIGTQRYADRWKNNPASAALIQDGLTCENPEGKSLIVVENADLAFSKVLAWFAPPPVEVEPGIHPTAVVHESAHLGDHVRVGPFCVIGPGATIGSGTVLHHRVTIFDHASVGTDCVFWPGVVIRDRCIVGDRCVIHSNAVIGTDGFGYRPETTEQGTRIVKVPQIGIVRIGNDVEIGANTCIDRAKCNETVIGDGCKLDNLVQIGHNCRLGRMVVISGCTGVGGSTVIGDGSMIGGHTAIADHVTIGQGVQLAGGSQVASDIPDGAVCAGAPARPIRDAIREAQALKRLPQLLKDLRRR